MAAELSSATSLTLRFGGVRPPCLCKSSESPSMGCLPGASPLSFVTVNAAAVPSTTSDFVLLKLLSVWVMGIGGAATARDP